MNFFASQEAARRQTRWLVLAFVVSVLLVVLAIDTVALFCLRAARGVGPQALDGEWVSLLQFGLRNPGFTFWLSLLVLLFIGSASVFKMLKLQGGGGVVARALGGVRVDRATQDPVRRRLLNVVEEMSIAAGVPMPEVYVIEQETAINAFAAGHTTANAAVAVTQGTLRRLNREQLQGVIAHEFSHVLNGDMRLSMRLMGMVFGLLAVAMAGRLMLRLSRDSEKATVPVFVVGLAVLLIGYVGLACARVIQALISRRREQLADASAVQFTRNPQGLKAALLRAAAQGRATGFSAADAEEIGHMLFLGAGQRLVATHPPLLERLQALEPGYTRKRMDEEASRIRSDWDRERQSQDAPAMPEPESGTPERLEALLDVAVPATAAAIAATIGDPQERHMDRARELRRALPEAIRVYAAAPEAARQLMCALLLSREAPIRERQLQEVSRVLGAAQAAAVGQALVPALALAPLLRLPAVLRLFPVLRGLPLQERTQLRVLVDTLVRSDARIDVFEFALGKLVADALEQQIAPAPLHGRATLAERAADIGVLFAVLARHGCDDETAARRAYEQGIGSVLPRLRPDYAFPADWAVEFGAALDRVASLQPAAKELLIEGLVRTIAHDACLTAPEAELLRTVCGVLQCPLPPILPETD